MKTIKVTYTEVIYVTNEKTINVTEAEYKKLRNEKSEFYQDLKHEMSLNTVAYDSYTEVDQRFLDIELA